MGVGARCAEYAGMDMAEDDGAVGARGEMGRKRFLMLAAGAVGGAAGCGQQEVARGAPEAKARAKSGAAGRLPFSFRTSGYRVVAGLPEERRPWRDRPVPWAGVTPDGTHTYLDGDGVLMYRPGPGAAGREQPVAQIEFGLGCAASCRTERDPARRRVFLRRARAQAERLIERRKVLRGGAWFFPYPFDFAHPTHTGISYRAPWYSGMAQGEAVSLFLQLAALDGVGARDRARYRAAADGAFASLLRGDDGKPWVVDRDRQGYLWIQEYPMDPPHVPDHTFNGMMFATFGLWDYVTATGDPRARKLYDGAVTTARHFFGELRNPGGVSYYCRTHRITSRSYHKHHIRLYRQLAWQTGDSRFARMAELLRSDADPDDGFR